MPPSPTQDNHKLSLAARLTRLEGWRAACLWALIVTAVLRLGLGAVMATTWTAVKARLPSHQLDDPAIYGELDMPITFPADALAGVWVRWDAVHHLNLAQRGYFEVPEADTIFYPLYAFLTRLAAGLLGGDTIVAGLAIACLATWAALTSLYRLTDCSLGPAAARWSILALAAFPTSFFLLAPFTESLFLALTLGAFLAAYRGRWWIAGAFGLLASLTRGPGMLSALALALIAWKGWRGSARTLVAYWVTPMLAAVGLPLAGGLAFLFWRQTVGFASTDEILRRYSGVILTNPVSGILESLRQWHRVGDLTMTLEVLSVPIFLALTAAMLFNSRWRKPEWLAYVFVNLSLFLSKQSLTGSSLQSLPRYVLVLFPCFVIIGDWLASRSQRTRFAYMAASSAALVVLSMLYALWVFIA